MLKNACTSLGNAALTTQTSDRYHITTLFKHLHHYQIHFTWFTTAINVFLAIPHHENCWLITSSPNCNEISGSLVDPHVTNTTNNNTIILIVAMCLTVQLIASTAVAPNYYHNCNTCGLIHIPYPLLYT